MLKSSSCSAVGLPDKIGLMEITVVKDQKTKKWTAKISNELFKGWATADRPGCAIRDVLNKFQYTIGAPSEDLVVTIEGW